MQAEQNQVRSQLEKAEQQLVLVKKDRDEMRKKLQAAEHTVNTHNTTVANFEEKINKMQKEKVNITSFAFVF